MIIWPEDNIDLERAISSHVSDSLSDHVVESSTVGGNVLDPVVRNDLRNVSKFWADGDEVHASPDHTQSSIPEPNFIEKFTVVMSKSKKKN